MSALLPWLLIYASHNLGYDKNYGFVGLRHLKLDIIDKMYHPVCPKK